MNAFRYFSQQLSAVFVSSSTPTTSSTPSLVLALRPVGHSSQTRVLLRVLRPVAHHAPHRSVTHARRSVAMLRGAARERATGDERDEQAFASSSSSSPRERVEARAADATLRLVRDDDARDGRGRVARRPFPDRVSDGGGTRRSSSSSSCSACFPRVRRRPAPGRGRLLLLSRARRERERRRRARDGDVAGIRGGDRDAVGRRRERGRASARFERRDRSRRRRDGAGDDPAGPGKTVR